MLARLFAVVPILLAASSCASTQVPAQEADATSCPTSEIAFTRADGCMNDGSVEFCLPANDAEALAAVHTVAPTVTCSQGSGGRARCNTATESLCMLETSEASCEAPHGALTESAWQSICDLASLPDVRSIVPTFYE